MQLDAKVSDLIGIDEAARILGCSWHQAQRKLNKGVLESVRLPGGRRAVIRSSVEAYARHEEEK